MKSRLATATRFASSLYHRGLPVLLSALMLNAGFGIRTADAAGREVGRTAKYDGETVFRGLFFGSGPVAALFPEIWDHPDLAPYLEQIRSAESVAVQNRFIARVSMEDLKPSPAEPSRDSEEKTPQGLEPTGSFFARFGEDLQSGDHLRIEQALIEGGMRLRKAAHSEVGVDLANVSPLNSLDGKCVVINFVAAVVVVAAVLVVTAVQIALYVDFWVTTPTKLPNPKGASGESSNLQHDMWIDWFATRLEAAR